MHQVSQLLCDFDSDLLTQEKMAAIFWAPKVPFPPQESLAILLCEAKGIASDCDSLFAIVRACYTMENGPNDINGKKWEKTWKICPDRKWGKNGRSGQFSIFSVFFGIFSHFRSGANFPRFSPFFSPFFVVRPVFHCVAGPHDCNSLCDFSRRKASPLRGLVGDGGRLRQKNHGDLRLRFCHRVLQGVAHHSCAVLCVKGCSSATLNGVSIACGC